MNGLDYLEISDVVQTRIQNVLSKSGAVEVTLVEKAKLIARKMNPSIDQHLYRKLMNEKKHIESVADLIDELKSAVGYFQTVLSETPKDYWTKAVEGGKINDEMKFLRDTVAVLIKREDFYITELRKKLNEQQSLRLNH